MSSYKLPFGKYKGRSIDYVSGSYLVWLSSVAQGELKQHCVDEIVRRFSVIIKEEELDFDGPDYNGDIEWWVACNNNR